MRFLIILTISLWTFSISALHAEEETIIKFADLPTIVQQSVLVHTKKAAIKKIELIHDEGAVKFEIETRDKGVDRDISFARNGEILEIEKVISPASLPDAALLAVAKDYPGLKIQTVEAVQKFYYDVEAVNGGKKIQFRVLATGDIEDEPNENN